MHRIDTPTAQKDKFGAGKNGFTRGNPQTGTPATDLDDDYFDMLQEELAGVVEASGVNLEKSKHNQLLTAMKALLLSRAHPFADIKTDGAAAIAEALSNLGLSDAFLIKEKYLPASLNLNTLGGEGKYGIYAQPVTNNATTENNYPTPEAGALLVTPAANNGMHVYITLSGHLWSRTSLDNKNTQWSQWVRQALKSELDDGLNLKFDSSSLSTAGRALVAKPTVSDMRAYLQLLSAAQRDVGTGANQIPDMNAFSGSIVSKGYQKFPGGLIIQWGINNASVGGTPGNGEDVSYAIPFPNGCLSLTATFDNGGPVIPSAAASIVDNVYFKLRCSEASGSYIFRWIALGF